MAERTWDEREQPLLEAVFELEEEGEHPTSITTEALAERSGLDESKTVQAVWGLGLADYLVLRDGSTMGGNRSYYGISLMEKGRRSIHQWPPEAGYEAFIELLRMQQAQEDDPEQKRKLGKVIDAASDVGKDVLGSVVSALIRQGIGA